MVALSNPRTEAALVSLGAVVAKQQGGSLLATHIVQVPDQTALSAAAENRERIDSASEDLLKAAKSDADEFGVPVETRTILSHRGLAEVFDAARTHAVDTVVMGYAGARFGGGRAEGAIEELANDLPCDFLVFDGVEFDPSRVLVPTAGGYSSDISAAFARALRETVDAEVSLLYVAEDGDKDTGRAFLTEWATEHGLADAELLVDSGDVEAAIEQAAADRTLVVIGATERGLLSRVVGGSLALSVLEDIETPVVLAEHPTSRSLRERLFRRR
jgi:nucleotide-binding universal stress UspA family protein